MTTPKPLRKEIKKRVSGLREMYKKDPDVKKSGMGKAEIRNMKKNDLSDVKKIVKKFGK